MRYLEYVIGHMEYVIRHSWDKKLNLSGHVHNLKPLVAFAPPTYIDASINNTKHALLAFRS